MQPDSDQILLTFEKLLLSELATGRLLQHCLQAEQTHLHTPDTQALQQDTARKAAILKKLSDMANNRLNWMSQQGLPLSDELTQHALLQDQPKLQRLWQELAAQYQTNRLTAENLSEQVLALRHRTQQQLKLLRGQNTETLTYTNTGNTRSSGDANGYISA